MSLQSILVPLDGRAQALAILPVAGTLARTIGATLHILHVGEGAFPPREMLRELGIMPEEFRGSVFNQSSGRPAEEILRFAKERPGALIAMCTHTGTDKPAGVLGSVAEEVLRHAACPVLLVLPERGLQPWALRRILLPHDGTPTTAAAMDPAGELAHRSGAEILVLHVAAPKAEWPGEPGTLTSPRYVDQPREPGTLTSPRYVDQPQHEWPAWASEFLDRMTALGHPPAEVRCRLSMATGEPGKEIVRFAHHAEADLIVLAWHGGWEAERAPTMKKVIRDSARPVFALRVEPRLPTGAQRRT